MFLCRLKRQEKNVSCDMENDVEEENCKSQRG